MHKNQCSSMPSTDRGNISYDSFSKMGREKLDGHCIWRDSIDSDLNKDEKWAQISHRSAKRANESRKRDVYSTCQSRGRILVTAKSTELYTASD